MFGNHFRILNARMVQIVESVWTVLYILYTLLAGVLPVTGFCNKMNIYFFKNYLNYGVHPKIGLFQAKICFLAFSNFLSALTSQAYINFRKSQDFPGQVSWEIFRDITILNLGAPPTQCKRSTLLNYHHFRIFLKKK